MAQLDTKWIWAYLCRYSAQAIGDVSSVQSTAGIVVTKEETHIRDQLMQPRDINLTVQCAVSHLL
jgi:hypothetical protein